MVIKQIIKELVSAKNPIAKPLHQNDSFRVLMLGFNEGMILKDHKTNWPTKLTILEGEVEYIENGEVTSLGAYETHDIPVGILHAVIAKKDSLCLLTQSKV